ncbi:cerebellin-3-like [Physella acuta]|uniref:cerebellin-3-like n=1 Tax=Physella acuta TaxID=109671 RepID=UPI0027DE9299|nr:cerebellin-3-like [Physella acuta]
MKLFHWCLFIAFCGTISAQCVSKSALKLYNRCYELVTTPMTWNNALNYCRNFAAGGTLAKVSNPSELIFLHVLMEGILDNIWIGANDIETEGYYVWTDKTEAHFGNLWSPADPAGTTAENCVGIGNTGKLFDDNCESARAFACMELGQSDLYGEIAFTAGLSSPLNLLQNQIVVYNEVLTNIGGAYNKRTGVFKAPVAGLYMFQVHGAASNSSTLKLALGQNDTISVTAYNNMAGLGINEASNSAVLQLEKNDEVYVSAATATSLLGARTAIVNTFSGFLIEEENY